MAERIEDYALLGDTQTAALVSKGGSIDWLCFPRFDSGACFAALLGHSDHGRWLIAPEGEVRRTTRRYRGDSLILETEFETDDGVVALIDFMPIRGVEPDLVRIVEGRRGRVPLHMELTIRFDYGSIVPWVKRDEMGLKAIAGPDALRFRSTVDYHAEDLAHVSHFSVARGERASFVITWYPSHEEPPPEVDAEDALEVTEAWWKEWVGRCTYDGDWRDAVVRSIVTLKALTYAPTGGIVAAPTTSLPEALGGVRNWDYRYCWLRDATFTLYALHVGGYEEEAKAWRDWLLRAVAGQPSQMQIMYGAAGERRLTELELPWLPGYEGSSPVRIGNAAVEQFQLDVYGEVMDALHVARRAGVPADEPAWRVQLALMDFLESHWDQPDEGIWEVRGPRRHFTHSKMMAWVALDRAVRGVEEFGLEGPLDRWRGLRQEIHDRVCRDGYDAERGAFVQHFGSKELDASLLMMPLVGFLPATDRRVVGTIEAIERELMADGFVARYRTHESVDGLPPGEGAFLACTFWLAEDLSLIGRHEDGVALFERLLGLRNDVGLLSEEYDPRAGRLVGNFPQAFSHVALVNCARHLCGQGAGPAGPRWNR